MKTILFLSFLFLSIFSNAQTDVYHPFPESNASWNNVYYSSSGCWIELYYSTIIGPDTSINGVTYHSLQTPEFVDIYSPSCNGFPIGYQGCYRQDTNLRQVFFVSPGTNTENVLCDFNLSIGDTVKGWPASGFFCITPFIVSSIDSVFLGGNYRKAWRGAANQMLIEGIGTTYGLLSPVCNLFEEQYSLLCFKQDTLIYPDGTEPCSPLNGVRSPEVNSKLNIAPNPFNNSSTLTVWDVNFINSNFILYNSFGEIVFRQIVFGFNTTLYKSNLSAGVYFYKLVNSKGKMLNGSLIIN